LAVNAGRSCAANAGTGSGEAEDGGAGAGADPADELRAVQAELTKPTTTAVAPASHALSGGCALDVR
jgi:hypothetical protein